ncbi:hypothetical protein [Flavihumibacter sp. CACIAM 22H1]|uniref:hypothetical protein n=1 Tax=Flavihumibacter sp. CACIAM 22H1 TaxID=1812911 RepID=UPI0007A8F157|nr:hypothetical protein [Flavihumibacter sp. CACIAM 22H1]KYP12952.1 MAG: hypothetical protein A1D16_15820 [Flavihumibacter sp. CACIAM 22H1]
MLPFEQQYAHEIGRVFNQTALLPGCAAVTPGQVIRFNQVRRANWKPEPLPVGAFKVLENQPGFGDEPPQVEEEAETRTIRYANGPIYWEAMGADQLTIRMPVPGSLFFLAIECSVFRLTNSLERLRALRRRRKEPWWKECHLVTGLTVARRALIVQAASEHCYFELEGRLEELMNRGGARLRESDNLRIRNARGTALEISWQQQMPIVMETEPLYRSTISRILSIPGLTPSPLMVFSFFDLLKALLLGSGSDASTRK